MQITKNTVVTLKYQVIDSDGKTVDAGEYPLNYLHGGYGGIFPAVEDALEGKQAGDDVSLKLQPADAFGDYDANLIRIEPRSAFPSDVTVGMRFEGAANGSDDYLLFTVTDIIDDKVMVDGNHPLAGAALVFSCSVTAVRPASNEEIGHGHVHDESCGHED